MSSTRAHLGTLGPGDQGLAGLAVVEHRRRLDIVPVLLEEGVSYPVHEGRVRRGVLGGASGTLGADGLSRKRRKLCWSHTLAI